MITSIEKFINSIGNIITVFDGNYDGGDFCCGLIFGKYGARMLTDIADNFLVLPEDHDPSKKVHEEPETATYIHGKKRPIPKSVQEMNSHGHSTLTESHFKSYLQ